MGNTLITSLCRREERVDLEDISDATFDFISVAVHKEHLNLSTDKTKPSPSTATRKSVSSQTHASKIVAVVPVALAPSLSSRTIVGFPAAQAAAHDGDDAMSFNERLNMLTWDPETTPLPTPFKHDEMYVFDEYAPTPTNVRYSTKATQTKDGWIRRAVDKYQETKTRRRDAKLQHRQRLLALQQSDTMPTPRQTSTKKRSLRMTLWGKRDATTKTETIKTKDLPYQLPLMSSMSSVLDEDDEEQRFLMDPDVTTTTTTAQDQALLKTKRSTTDDEPISDTESDDSGSDATTLCRFYTRFDEDAASTSSNDLDDDSESDFSDWTRSTSSSSCHFSAAEDDSATSGDDDDASFFSSQDALCVALSDYLCACDDCPAYMTIEREVTNSNCWMNETERRALCRVLQAYSTYRPKTAFQKDMIAAAEECLLVFQGDEHAAFNAFVMLAQTKW
jgi:hypothetical protein